MIPHLHPHAGDCDHACCLKIEHLSVHIGGETILDNIDLHMHCGQMVALIGPNGAGKTTAFNVITGVYQPTNGRVQFQGDTIIENHPRGKMRKNYLGENAELYSNSIIRTPDRITKLGIARTFQNIRLFKAMTVFENVLIATHMRSEANVFSATFGLNRREEMGTVS